MSSLFHACASVLWHAMSTSLYHLGCVVKACLDVPIPVNAARCCLTSGCVGILSPNVCLSIGGAPGPVGSTCFPGACTTDIPGPVTGACCLFGGAQCLENTFQNQCVNTFGGVFRGIDTICPFESYPAIAPQCVLTNPYVQPPLPAGWSHCSSTTLSTVVNSRRGACCAGTENGIPRYCRQTHEVFCGQPYLIGLIDPNGNTDCTLAGLDGVFHPDIKCFTQSLRRPCAGSCCIGCGYCVDNIGKNDCDLLHGVYHVMKNCLGETNCDV